MLIAFVRACILGDDKKARVESMRTEKREQPKRKISKFCIQIKRDCKINFIHFQNQCRSHFPFAKHKWRLQHLQNSLSLRRHARRIRYLASGVSPRHANKELFQSMRFAAPHKGNEQRELVNEWDDSKNPRGSPWSTSDRISSQSISASEQDFLQVIICVDDILSAAATGSSQFFDN